MPDPGYITQIAVVSGKGGTGKTCITGSFVALARDAVIADCDVDAANLALILDAKDRSSGEFSATAKATIDPGKCSGCGKCATACRSRAISVGPPYAVSHLNCEGCGICRHVCEEGAIAFSQVTSGTWHVADTPYGTLVHAALEPGEENSGKLVTLVRNKALACAQAEGARLVLVDGPPGIGCPVIATLSGVSIALVVVEPTVSAIHDMQRVLQLCKRFGIEAAVCINKCDVCEDNCQLVEATAASMGTEVIGRIPYDPDVVSSMIRGRPVVETSSGNAALAIHSAWDMLLMRATKDPSRGAMVV